MFKCGLNQEPSITRLPGNEFLLGKDECSMFVDMDAKPVRSYGIRWSEPPLGLGTPLPRPAWRYAGAAITRATAFLATAVLATAANPPLPPLPFPPTELAQPYVVAMLSK